MLSGKGFRTHMPKRIQNMLNGEEFQLMCHENMGYSAI